MEAASVLGKKPVSVCSEDWIADTRVKRSEGVVQSPAADCSGLTQ